MRAIALAFALGLAWALRDWPNLSHLHLPDTDDVVRLQQVRDWIGGQRFADLSQHRLGVGGLPMHWSRIADLGPAAILLVLTPLFGRASSEIVMVAVWPPMLFAVALFLVARIARHVAPDAAPTATIVAALAYPVTTLFVPGRIDHHNLQIVALLAIVLALLGPRTWRNGAIAGVAAVASLVIGLETAPLLAVVGAVLAIEWIAVRPGADIRLLGFGTSASITLLVARLVFHTDQWAFPACDGFDAQAWRAAQIVALAPIAMVLLGRRPMLRMAVAVLVGLVAIVTALRASPACLSPYGAVDPVLAKLWLTHVGEAQPLFAAPFATGFGYVGLLVAGIAATGFALRRDRSAGWAILLLLQLAALVLSLAQLRGAYAGAILAAPGLAALIGTARRRGSLHLVAAWIVSAGMLYPLLASARAPATRSRPTASADCTAPDAIARLATLPAGRMIAPIDLGAYALAGTPHTLLAAPYHRDTAGNRAMYAVMLSPPATAKAIVDRLHVDYVVTCAGPPDWPGATPPASLAAALRAGRVPSWLKPALRGAPTVYAVVRR